METDQLTAKDLKTLIVGDILKYLIALKSGSSIDELRNILREVRRKESLLCERDSSVLDPDLWKYLYVKYSNRMRRPACNPS